MAITTLIRLSIEPRAIAMYQENWQRMYGWLPPAWETANETTRNRWRIRAWLEALQESKNDVRKS